MVCALCACGQTAAPAASTPAAEAPAAEEPAAEAPAEEAPKADVEPVVLKVATSQAEGSIFAESIAPAIANIEERTEGRVTFEVYYSNALGSIADCVEQLSMGANMLVSTSASSWAAYGCDDMTALDNMFAFASTDEIANFNESEMWANMVAELEANGNMHIICMNWAGAPRVLMTKNPVNSVADFKGVLVRVPSNTYAAWFNALGASPVSGIPFSEVYQNIESGVIDGAEAPFNTLRDYSLQEVAKYAYCSNHTYAASCLGVNSAIWNMISAEDQAVITEELSAAGAVFTQKSADANQSMIDAMIADGVTVVNPSDEDVAALQAAAVQAAKDLGCRDGVMDEIKAAAQG